MYINGGSLEGSSSSILVAVVLNWDADMPYHERVYTPREWVC